MNSRETSTEVMFVKLGLFFGLLFALFIPPFMSPDEDSHYKRAFDVAYFRIVPCYTGEGVAYSFLNLTNIQFENEFRPMMPSFTLKYTFDRYTHWLTTPLTKDKYVAASYSSVSAHPFYYLPQATGMLMIRILHRIFPSQKTILTPLNLMLSARLFNLAAFLIMGYFTIKIIPFYKNLMMLLLLMPMTIYLASSVSYDGMTIAAAFLTIATSLHLVFIKQKLDWSDCVKISVLAIFLFEFKQVYIFAALLLLPLLFAGRHLNRDSAAKLLPAPIAAILFHLVWVLMNYNVKTPALQAEQVSFVLHHPFQYVLIVIHSLSLMLNGYITSFVGTLGWLNVHLPILFVWSYVALLIVFALTDTNSTVTISWKYKAFSFGIFIAIVFFLETALYITWTSVHLGVGSDFVDGVQGRYFIPAAPLLLLPFYLNSAHSRFSKIMNRAGSILSNNVNFIVIISLTITVVITAFRYY
jgi:uncharacterized membrane protein